MEPYDIEIEFQVLNLMSNNGIPPVKLYNGARHFSYAPPTIRENVVICMSVVMVSSVLSQSVVLC